MPINFESQWESTKKFFRPRGFTKSLAISREWSCSWGCFTTFGKFYKWFLWHPVFADDYNTPQPLTYLCEKLDDGSASKMRRRDLISYTKCTATSRTLIRRDRHSLQWRHDERDGVSIHQPHNCLLKRLFRRRSKKTPKLRVTGFCVGNSQVTGEFPAQRASNAENVPIWWRHHGGDIVVIKPFLVCSHPPCKKVPCVIKNIWYTHSEK